MPDNAQLTTWPLRLVDGPDVTPDNDYMYCSTKEKRDEYALQYLKEGYTVRYDPVEVV